MTLNPCCIQFAALIVSSQILETLDDSENPKRLTWAITFAAAQAGDGIRLEEFSAMGLH
jgi:hypothetical protein